MLRPTDNLTERLAGLKRLYVQVKLPPTGLNRPIFAYFCGGVSLAASARFGETAGKATEKGAWGVLGKAAAEHLQNVLGGL